MPCPTCDHTMHNFNAHDNTQKIFWCPRCGTLKTVRLHDGAEIESSEVPTQVRLLGDAAMFVRRMAYMLTGAAIHDQAMAWLRKHNLEGSVLRDE